MEAALAFDTCYERYPNTAKAPEAVYQALMQYVALASAEKKPIFKTRVEERRKTLTSKFPTHDRAAFAQLVEGDTLTSEDKFLEAVDSYSKVQASSPSYYDAQLRIGSCYYQQARTLDKAGKKSEAAQYYTQAETILKKSIDDFDRLASDNLDLEKLARYEKNGFNARRQLSDLYLQIGKFDKVLPLLDGADTKYANDADALSQIWSLRIRALKEQGKLEDAIKLLDALAAKNTSPRAIASGAGLIARELDQQAAAASEAKKTKEANDLWRRAANYYGMSGRALLKTDSIRPADVEAIAERLYVLGLLFNGVPETTDTFIGWDTKKLKETKLWELSAELYQAGLRISPSTKAQLNLARISAFLGRWKVASDAFGEFSNSSGSVFDPIETKKLARGVTAEAIQAYIERGVCDLMVATAENDKNRLNLAEDTFNRLYAVLKVDSATWWQSAYYLVKCRYERGNYREADDLLQGIERATNKLGGDTSLAPAFIELKKDIAKKNPQGTGQQAPPPPPKDEPAGTPK
jgi:tetratricopeptide (TPR) repeat protein